MQQDGAKDLEGKDAESGLIEYRHPDPDVFQMKFSSRMSCIWVCLKIFEHVAWNIIKCSVVVILCHLMG